MQLGLCNWKNSQPCVIKCLLQARPTRLAWALVWEAAGMGQCWDGAAPGGNSAAPTDVLSFPGIAGMTGEERISPWRVEGAAPFQELVGATPARGNWGV